MLHPPFPGKSSSFFKWLILQVRYAEDQTHFVLTALHPYNYNCINKSRFYNLKHLTFVLVCCSELLYFKNTVNEQTGVNNSLIVGRMVLKLVVHLCLAESVKQSHCISRKKNMFLLQYECVLPTY
uniref:Uncharacterized protein n=1 Tax=Anguilla anguilla TaxID=7936 RepID=A0A0E9X3I5_ANGAN